MKALIVAVLAVAAAGAGAAGLTDEETDLVRRQLGGAQLMFSDDGHWRLRTHGALLVRESSGESSGMPTAALQVDVGGVVQALAASHDASRVVVHTEDRCVLLIDFAAGAAPRSRWLATPLVSEIDQGGVACPQPGIPSEHRTRVVALSPDGHRVALQGGGELRLIDVEASRVLWRWPLAQTEVLQLAFLDGGRRLFVRAARLGQAW